MFLPFSLIILTSFALFSYGDTVEKQPTYGQCSQENTKLEAGSYELAGDCGPTDYCAINGTCLPKGCRRDDFPFGYPQGSKFPDKCPTGQFCPDEEDACQTLLAVGSGCQLNRDDQCAPPPDAKDLSSFPSNVNGSVCLNFLCMWANKTANEACTLENTPYIAYTTTSEFAFIVSRGDCRPGLYCDAVSKTCLQTKDFGVNCTADKECQSDNCLVDSTCGLAPDAPSHFPLWVYIAVGAGIFGGMTFTLISLFFLHRRARDEDREKRTQYWREQTAFRQNIMHLKETARSGYLVDNNDPPSQIASGESQIPMLPAKGSGLRNNMSDDDRDEGDYPGLINTTTPRRRISRPRQKR